MTHAPGPDLDQRQRPRYVARMMGVSTTALSRRFRFWRIASALALIAQIVTVAVAPSAEAIASHSAPVHVEAGGTHLHHSHNPADCPACLALALSASGLPSLPAVPRLAGPLRAVPSAARPAAITRPRRIAPHAPRAPPAILLASR